MNHIPLRARHEGWLEPTRNPPYSFPMDSTPSPSPRPPWDRWVAVAMLGLAALLAAGWIMRERQLATDQAESREDLRQAMHRLKTLSSSTDQIRNAYLQRKSELDATRKKLEQATARPAEDRSPLLRKNCPPQSCPHGRQLKKPKAPFVSSLGLACPPETPGFKPSAPSPQLSPL